MKFARIEDGFVVETLTADTLPEFHPSLVWRECANTVVEGHSYDGNVFSAPSLISLDDLKASRSGEVNALRDQKYAEGVTHGGVVFDLTAEAQKDMLATQLNMVLGAVLPHGGAWRTADNAMVRMNDKDAQLFFQAASLRVKQIKTASWAHKDNIKLLVVRQDIEDYDIAIGWE